MPVQGAPLAGVSAAQFLVSTLRGAPGQVTLLALAGLTNVAAALRLDPGIAGLWVCEEG